MEVDDVESVDKSKTSELTPKPAYTTTPKSKEDLQSDKVDKEETPKTDKDDKVVTEQESPYPWRRPSKPKEEPEKINDTFIKPNDQSAKDEVTDSVKDKDMTKDTEKSQTLHPWAKTKEVPILITPEPENEKEVPFSWQVIPEIPQV
ncbi:uncharacterized protein LOC123666550 [Melitaea cinxia]|uniref:uncharacterized protein LOC123666550 n=1 Tax=Melitaea cinxia TaxID=113334 RepID=UPI001E2708F5|nr:uncharacterized protein LOC123666550 [Melitaea cinxia]